MRPLIPPITNPSAPGCLRAGLIAIAIGVPALGVAAIAYDLITGGDHQPASEIVSAVREVEVCPSSPEDTDGVRAALGQWERRCWHSARVVDSDCTGPVPYGVARIRSCTDVADRAGGSPCDAADHPGWTDWREDSGVLESAEIRLAAEYRRSTLVHEIGHGVYGVGLDRHDTRATRIMHAPSGSSWEGLDRCPGVQ